MSKKENVSVNDEISTLEGLVSNDKSDSKKSSKKKTKDLKKKVAAVGKNPLKKKTAKKVVNAVVGKSEMLKVNPKKLLVVWEDNLRADYGDIKTLEASIKERGVENPVRVKRLNDGQLKLEAGYRRIKACLNLIESGHKINSIHAILEKAGTSEKESLIHVFVENDGKNFNPIEEANLFVVMKKDHGMKTQDIAKALGRSNAAIISKLGLLNCSKNMQKALRESEINMLTATRIINVSKKDHSLQDKLLTTFKKIADSGNKSDVKKAKSVIAKASGERIKNKGITQQNAKILLEDLAVKYIDFVRSKKPASSMNKKWTELESSLKKVRTLKRKGEFN